MEYCTIQNAGLSTWSNSKKNSCLFATATKSSYGFNHGTSPSSNGLLQIFSFDMMNKKSSSVLMGKASLEESNFTCLDWQNFGESDNYPYGIIAAGLDDGCVSLWDPSQMFASGSKKLSDSEVVGVGCLSLQELHKTPAHCLEINALKPNLIASGGSEVYIQNIEKDPSKPEVFSPGSPNYHEGSSVSSVSWNRHVPYILASSSQNGLTVVWDLRNKNPIFNISEADKGNRSLIASWNPEISCQLAVIYDNDKYPEVQIWDLRHPQGPMASLPSRSKGLHKMDWYSRDPSLIMTAGRDNKTYLWNYKTGELLHENQLDSEVSSMKWSSKLPGIYSLSYISGETSILSINDDTHQIEGDWAPDWLKPKCGARFAFDGRLVTFSEKNGSVVQQYYVADNNPVLNQAVEELEKYFGTDDANVAAVSDHLSANLEYTPEEREEWNFIKLQSTSQAKNLIRYLGYNEKEITKKAEEYTGKAHKKRDEEQTSSVMKPSKHFFDYVHLSTKEAENFFDKISEDPNKLKKSLHKELKSGFDRDNGEEEKEVLVPETHTKNINWEAGVEKIIKANLLIGNIEGAIDCLLKCGRTAEALLLAYSKGTELFQNTAKAFFVQSNDHFVKNVIGSVYDNKFEELVRNYPLDSWKECVAMCASLNEPKQFRLLIDLLGDRFLKANCTHQALLCFILSHNMSKILEVYFDKYKEFPRNSIDRKVFLIWSFEKCLSLRNLIGDHASNNIFDKFVIEVALVLSNLDKTELALRFLDLANLKNPAVLRIRDRIFHSQAQITRHFKIIDPPFSVEHVSIKSQVRKGAIGGLQGKPQPIARKDMYSLCQPIRPISEQQSGKKPMPVCLFTPPGDDGKQQKTGEYDKPPIKGEKRLVNFGTVSSGGPDDGVQQETPTQLSKKVTMGLSHVVPSFKDKIVIPPKPGFGTKPRELGPSIKQPLSGPPKSDIGKPPVSSRNLSTAPKSGVEDALSKLEKKAADMPQPDFGSELTSSKVLAKTTLQPGPMKNPFASFQNPEEAQATLFVDPSLIPPKSKIIYSTLMDLISRIEIIETNTQKQAELAAQIQAFFVRLVKDNVNPKTLLNIVKMCEEINKKNLMAAFEYYQAIAREDWEANKDWMLILKRLLSVSPR